MDILKTIGVSALVAVVVVTVGLTLFPKQAAQVKEKLGSLAGPDIPSPYLRWGSGNGVRSWKTAVALTQGTTTVCAIQSPAATSTLRQFGIEFDVSSSTAEVVDIARNTTAFGTTTKIGTTYSIGAAAQAFIQASTSPAAGAATVFPPSNWVVVKAQGGVTGGDAVSAANSAGYIPTGSCSADFQEFPTF